MGKPSRVAVVFIILCGQPFSSDADAAQSSKKVSDAATQLFPGENEFVPTLTKSNFDTIRDAHRALLVLFYADWSTTSWSFRPTFTKIARVLDGRVKAAGIDCSRDRHLAKRFNVSSYPKIMLFAKGETIEYPSHATRSIEDIVNFAKLRASITTKKWRKAEEQSVIEVTEDNLEHILTRHSLMFIMFHAPSCEHCEQLRPEWAIAGHFLKGRVQLGSVNLLENRLGAKYDMKHVPTMKLFINKAPRFDFEGDHEAIDIVKWVESFEVGRLEDDVLELEKEDFHEALATNELLMVQFYTLNSEVGKVLYPEWVRAGHALQEEIQFARVDVETEKEIAEEYSINVTEADDFPIVKLFRQGVPEDYTGSQQQKAVVKWARSRFKSSTDTEL